MFDRKVKKWVDLALENEDIHDYSIRCDGTSSKDDGYVSNIFFVVVTGQTNEKKTKTINLAIKASKESETLREQTPLRETFEKEIFVYDRVLESFRNFQTEMNAPDLLDYIPRCYLTRVRNDGELLVFEDLKSRDYRTCDKKVPMTFEHLKLVLEAYGKWHAFSFALRKEKPEVFRQLTKDNVNLLCYWFEKTNMIELALDLFEKSRDGCISSDDEGVLDKIKFTKEDAYYMFKGLFSEEADYRVISHGDCWNNNFMFKYDDDTSNPVSVQILDWQCAGLSSPVMDLSHFLYGCCNTAEHKDVSEMLKIYYGSFSECLRSLRCDPDELFPYAKLVEHWMRFSRYGIFLHGFVIKFTLCDADDAPDYVEAAERGKDFLENFNIKVSNEKVFHGRIRNNLLHYVKNLNLSDKY